MRDLSVGFPRFHSALCPLSLDYAALTYAGILTLDSQTIWSLGHY